MNPPANATCQDAGSGEDGSVSYCYDGNPYGFGGEVDMSSCDAIGRDDGPCGPSGLVRRTS